MLPGCFRRRKTALRGQHRPDTGSRKENEVALTRLAVWHDMLGLSVPSGVIPVSTPQISILGWLSREPGPAKVDG